VILVLWLPAKWAKPRITYLDSEREMMPEYDFQSLSSFDFQILSRDLLQKRLDVVLESFGSGKDKGTDFRLRDSSGSLVVQCKHYKDYVPLLQVLKKHELEKVKKLKPTRYILTLSTSLTPDRKDEIFGLFAPYCQSPSDIFGREDLNNLLGLYPDVERKNIKLWLTSTAVLERFLHAAVWNDTALTLQRLNHRARLYVPNPSRGRARKILDQHHYCIIAGIPGIGKTMLAEILLIEYVNKYDYQAVRIANDLSEIRGVKDPARRQIFYFDDFLGTTALDRMQKNEDKRLIEFIDEVRTNDNWRFLLTTREYILNAAKQRYESLSQPVVDLTPCIIELVDYTEKIRARILYNHIYFSDLADSYKRALLKENRYEKVISHHNYNPRIVEYMTSAKQMKGISPEDYFQTFLGNLANPIMVWDHAFKHQLSEAGQHLVLVLGTLGDEVRLRDLEAAFHAFYSYRQKKLGFGTKSRDFENALKELDGNFIKISLVGIERVVTLHNPSLSDFLEYYFSTNPTDLMDLVQSANFFNQFINLWRGRRNNRYGAFDGGGGDELLQALGSKLMSSSSKLLRVKADQEGPDLGVQIQPISFEHRIAFVIEVGEIVNTARARKLKEELLNQFRSELLSKHGNKEHLVSLLKKVDALEKERSSLSSLFEAAKSYLLSVGDDSNLDDFEALCKFVLAFPDIVKSEELEQARGHFSNFCDNFDDSWADSPDDLRSIASNISDVGSILDVEVSELCGNLESHASEWEDELPISEELRADDDDEERWGRQEPSSDDTSAMFEGLLDELNESES
jgi:hypothetical protein